MSFEIQLIIFLTMLPFGIIVLFITNIAQKGGASKGESLDEILKCSPDLATKEMIHSLNKAEVMQLFYSAHAPDFSELNGEYKAETLAVGVLSGPANFFTHHFFGPGKWLGKAFTPKQTTMGWGYNLFYKKDSVVRTRKFNTYVGESPIDSKQSVILEYLLYNSGTVKSMKDEVRKINDRLFICMGYMSLGGGSVNPAPFILYGKPDEFRESML
jgi:hypothetical protein